MVHRSRACRLFLPLAFLTVLVGAVQGDAQNKNTLLCQVILNHIFFEPDSSGHAARDEFYGCHPVLPSGAVSGQLFTLEVPNHIRHHDRERIHNGQGLFLSIPGGSVSLQAVNVPNATAVRVVDLPANSQRRKLRESPPKVGVLTVLPLRIITPDSEPVFSAGRLEEMLFQDEVSLNKQMRRCSFDKLGFKPTKYGVLEVSVDVMADGNPYNVVSNAADAMAIELVDEDVENIREVADLVMFILPPGTNGGWAAYGNVNGVGTTFNNRWATFPGAQMHEIGHNLGLFHANEDGGEYGDTTGSMGSAPDVQDYPKRCFNGENNWHMGWFSDRSIELNPSSPTLVKVAAFVHYNKTDADEFVIVKVDDLYLQYNRAVDFNIDTGEKQNMLTVVRKMRRGTDLIASLDENEPASQIMLEEQGLLSIEVCDTVPGTSNSPDTMLVSVGIGNTKCPPRIFNCVSGFGIIDCAPPPPDPTTDTPTISPTTPRPTTSRPSPSPVRPWQSFNQLTRTRMPSPFQQLTRSPNTSPVPLPTTSSPAPAISNIFGGPSVNEGQPFSDGFDVVSDPDDPDLSPVQEAQSVTEQRNEKMKLAFIVITGLVGFAFLVILATYIRYRCLPKLTYYDVNERDAEDLPTSGCAKNFSSETDSSVSSESLPSQEFFVMGVAEPPAEGWRGRRDRRARAAAPDYDDTHTRTVNRGVGDTMVTLNVERLNQAAPPSTYYVGAETQERGSSSLMDPVRLHRHSEQYSDHGGYNRSLSPENRARQSRSPARKSALFYDERTSPGGDVREDTVNLSRTSAMRYESDRVRHDMLTGLERANANRSSAQSDFFV